MKLRIFFQGKRTEIAPGDTVTFNLMSQNMCFKRRGAEINLLPTPVWMGGHACARNTITLIEALTGLSAKIIEEHDDIVVFQLELPSY